MTPSSFGNAPDLIRLDRPVLVLGRGADADVRLPHPVVSRRHAELRADRGVLSVRDLRSRSGVFVNGVAITASPLKEDDVVAFGPFAYELKGGHLRRVLQVKGVELEAHGLTVRYGASTVLDNVNLKVPANAFVGILGPSGAGKTTLLKGLTGYLPADGQVFFDGLDRATHGEVCRTMIGYVPQEDVVYGSLTARENLDFALRLRVAGDLRPEERATWVGQTLKRLSLEEHADRPVRTLSGGQRKRVSVAVELLSRPRLLFLDEPTSGLDPAAEARLMHFLHDLSRRGTTVLCTTHVLESLNLFDSVLVVANGRLLGSGSPQNLLGHFQAPTYAELYEKLENPAAPPPARRGPLPLPAPAAATATRPTHSRPGTLNQIETQLQRGLLLILRDRVLLALLIGQPLLIGLLIALSQARPGETKKLDLLCTFAVVASIWLGLNNTAREVIRDRAVYVRERRGTVNPESYLLAKVLLYAGIGLLQIVLLVLWLRFCNFVPRAHDAHQAMVQLSLLRFVLVLWLTYLSAMLLGLIISTLAATEEVAIAILPLVILPQLLFSGVATELMRLRNGSFNALPVLLDRAGLQRPFIEWVLESVSLFTYSRPALVFFLNYKDPPARLNPTLVEVVNWAHVLVLLLATATVFVAVFLRRERRWLQTG